MSSLTCAIPGRISTGLALLCLYPKALTLFLVKKYISMGESDQLNLGTAEEPYI